MEVSVTFPVSYHDERYQNRNVVIPEEEGEAILGETLPEEDAEIFRLIADHLDLTEGDLDGMYLKRAENAVLIFPDPKFGTPDAVGSFAKKVSPLIGGTIVGVVEDVHFFGLQVDVPDQEQDMTLWIYRDEEGNFPGAVGVERMINVEG